MPGSTSSSRSPVRSPPSVDVLIPHHNDITGLNLALASVDAQDWGGNVRVVIADDGSDPDVVLELSSIVERRGPATILVRNKTNRGRPYTRNVLLDSAQSEYTTWLDAGDEWYPGKMSAQFGKLAELSEQECSEPVWMTCNYDWQWHGGRRRLNRQLTDRDQVRAMLRGQYLRAYLWTLLGTTESFRNVGWFDENLPRLQDLDFFIRFLLKNGVLQVPDEDRPYCVYHKSDVGRNAEEIRACNAYLFDKHRVLYNRYGASFRREQIYGMEMLSARFAKNNDDLKMRNQYMWRAFTTSPKLFLRHVRKKGFRP